MSNMYIGLFIIALVFVISMLFNLRNLLLSNYRKIIAFLLSLKAFPVNYVQKTFDTNEKEQTQEIVEELNKYLKAFEQSPKENEKVIAIRSNLTKMKNFMEPINVKLQEGWAVDRESRVHIENLRNKIVGIRNAWFNSIVLCGVIHLILFSFVFYLFISKFYH